MLNIVVILRVQIFTKKYQNTLVLEIILISSLKLLPIFIVIFILILGTTPVLTFYDTVTNKPLFKAPQGRTWEEFISESRSHGWPSFRDEEVLPEYLRVLQNGETVSVDGTHLGHNLPDGKGNRYCINIVCVAGKNEEQVNTKNESEL